MKKLIISQLVQKRMFLLIAMLFMFSTYGSGIKTGYNFTLGWMYDYNYWIFVINPYLWFTFLMGYGILGFIKYNTNKHLSIIHLILISLTFIFDNLLNADSRLILILILFSIIVFIANLILAIQDRKSKKTFK